MDRTHHSDIRIGTLVPLKESVSYIPQIHGHGFESYQLNSWAELPFTNFDEHAAQVRDIIGDQAVISSLGMFGNPLTNDTTREAFATLLRNARKYGAELVCGFTGALEDRPVDENMDRFREVWGELTRIAEGEGVRIAFENCDMGGTWMHPKWNIAHAPRAWRMMFDAVPSEAMGLEWEPCHQMVSLVDPLPQLNEWVGKIFHLHGKDAQIDWNKIKRDGIRCGEYIVIHRTPGFGDTNWTDVISILRKHGWRGSVDIEGWHDPVYRDDLEMTGQVHALNYLKACRGGAFVPNPHREEG